MVLFAGLWLMAIAPSSNADTSAEGRRFVVRLGNAALSDLQFKQSIPELEKLGLHVIELTADEVQQMEAAGIEIVQAVQRVNVQETIPNDSFWLQQYGPGRVQLPQAWDVSTGASGVIIAVIDTGIDLDHPDLQSKLVPGMNFVTGAQPPNDDHGHGTHVAGIAAASTNNSLGVAGASWGARLMPLKVLDATGNGDDADVAAAIVWAADHGANVINLSLGGPCPSPVMELAATYAYTMGVTLVAAAGNGAGPVLCPGAAADVMAVAATDGSDQRASFSNFGPQVDIAAPGAGIYSTERGGGYGYRSGTSMAAPFVAGVAAILAGQPTFDSPDKIRAAIENTALDLGQLCADIYYGHGLAQAYEALMYDPNNVHSPSCYFTYFPWISR